MTSFVASFFKFGPVNLVLHLLTRLLYEFCKASFFALPFAFSFWVHIQSDPRRDGPTSGHSWPLLTCHAVPRPDGPSDCPSTPAPPFLATPGFALPKSATPANPGPAMRCHRQPVHSCLACPVLAHRARTCPASPLLPNQALRTRRNGPIQSTTFHDCQTIPWLALPRRCRTRLPVLAATRLAGTKHALQVQSCRYEPGLDSPCRSSTCRDGRAKPRRSVTSKPASPSHAKSLLSNQPSHVMTSPSMPRLDGTFLLGRRLELRSVDDEHAVRAAAFRPPLTNANVEAGM